MRRLLVCPCQGASENEAKSVAVLDFGHGAAIAPELAYVTARYAAMAPFGKTADLLSELLPQRATARQHGAQSDTEGRRAGRAGSRRRDHEPAYGAGIRSRCRRH